jgi:hypothetical protein
MIMKIVPREWPSGYERARLCFESVVTSLRPAVAGRGHLPRVAVIEDGSAAR